MHIQQNTVAFWQSRENRFKGLHLYNKKLKLVGRTQMDYKELHRKHFRHFFLFASHLLKSSNGEICFELSQTTIHIKWAWIIRKWGWARAWVEFGSSCMHANWNSFDVNNVWILESWRKTFKLCQPVQIISVCSFFSRVVCVWFWENKKNLFK